MKEYFMLALTNPEVASSLAQVVVAVVGAVMTIVMPLALRTFNKLSFVKIEEKHAKAIQEGVQTWAESAITHGIRDANVSAVNDLKSYLRRTYPDAMAFLEPSGAALEALATRFIKKAIDR